ncbi:hypothetical protein INT44_004743 [Umbelopsis vinacea]|uniref:CCHC-type domain-containing protein n=1 Tax=Umbelopsis vinacea TaxID=44442 RepID=A0A8H7PDX7_9FUNG|nr:hypothetical protein INT44_004743 [Umbelopsis vinacea]
MSNALANTMIPFQTGFMPGRQISENSWTLQTLMVHARKADPQGSAVGVLLDQEKAYDRIHPEYLEKVMQALGISYMLIHCIIKLFFSTSVHISVNGFLALPFLHKQGLRQGDPLFPLLFNIAFEPLLRRLHKDPNLLGCPIAPLSWELHQKSFGHNAFFPDALPIKVLAYADDLVIFLSAPNEWETLTQHLQIYHLACNAKIVYEVDGFTNTQRSQRATSISKRALNPDAVLFEVPKGMLNPDLVVEEIVKEIGEIAGFTNLGLYRKDAKVNTLELLFVSPESTKKAIHEGSCPSKVLQLRWNKIAKDPFGKVMQVRKYTNEFGRFFGEASVLLERNQDSNESAELPRRIFMEDEDCFIPAFFQGAPQVCFHSRRAGHIRKDCQELARIQCYNCKGYGHMSRYCQNLRKEKSFEEVWRHIRGNRWMSKQQHPDKTMAGNSIKESAVESEQAPDIVEMSTKRSQVEAVDLIQPEEETSMMEMEDT